ncbi:MAG: SDR family oxidoreductase [Actinomycetota bacterium]|nr:SDR family oxidoreductase [Actinomycetota bacterium]
MTVLVTGGAGFLGSNLVDALLREGHEVRVLDDLSTGYRENVAPEAHLIEGDVADEDLVRKAMEGVEQVYHQAAHRAVLRSVQDPLATDRANTHGTVTVLKAAVDAGVRRFVYASSSSVYGGTAPLPTSESAPMNPRSPYAVSKLAAEHYCRVFAELYGLETVSLRYFNGFGPRQRPDSAYAAVIPLFIEALLAGEPPVVHGDGRQTRAFTYVDDIISANLAAGRAPADACRGQVYNVAGAERRSLLDLLEVLGGILGVEPNPVHTEPRAGDIRHSHADISLARQSLGYEPKVTFEEGLQRTVEWANRREA